MRLTRHNGRAGKNGVYNPKHNDRKFDVEHSEHIDAEKTKDNIYWDYSNIKKHNEEIMCFVPDTFGEII